MKASNRRQPNFYNFAPAPFQRQRSGQCIDIMERVATRKPRRPEKQTDRYFRTQITQFLSSQHNVTSTNRCRKAHKNVYAVVFSSWFMLLTHKLLFSVPEFCRCVLHRSQEEELHPESRAELSWRGLDGCQFGPCKEFRELYFSLVNGKSWYFQL